MEQGQVDIAGHTERPKSIGDMEPLLHETN